MLRFSKTTVAGWGLLLYIALAVLTFIFPALVGLGIALVEGTIWPDAVFAAVGVLGVMVYVVVKYQEEVKTSVTRGGNSFKTPKHSR